MTTIEAEQNLRLARKMLDQQGEINELRGRLAALETECAALAEALGDPNVTHPFDPMHAEAGLVCGAELEEGSYCALPAAAAVHRTPARVRAELGSAR